MCVGNTQMKILNKTENTTVKIYLQENNWSSMITTDLHHSTSAPL